MSAPECVIIMFGNNAQYVQIPSQHDAMYSPESSEHKTGYLSEPTTDANLRRIELIEGTLSFFGCYKYNDSRSLRLEKMISDSAAVIFQDDPAMCEKYQFFLRTKQYDHNFAKLSMQQHVLMMSIYLVAMLVAIDGVSIHIMLISKRVREELSRHVDHLLKKLIYATNELYGARIQIEDNCIDLIVPHESNLTSDVRRVYIHRKQIKSLLQPTEHLVESTTIRMPDNEIFE